MEFFLAEVTAREAQLPDVLDHGGGPLAPAKAVRPSGAWGELVGLATAGA